MTILEALRVTTESIKAWVESKFLKKDEVTADDFGVYVQDVEPTDVEEGDIWIDTASDPSVMDQDVPVTSVNGQTGDVVIEIPEVEIPEQVQPDLAQNDPTQPDYVKNRTHWEEGSGGTIEWDGTAEGKETIESDGATLVKISDIAPSFSDFKNVKYVLDGVEYTLADEAILAMDGYYFIEDSGFMVVTDAPVSAGATIPSNGCYHVLATGVPVITKLTYGSTVVHPLDEKFIPDSVARVADIPEGLPAVTTADNGKVLMVVDGAWAIVDINLSVDADGVLGV